MTSSSAHDAFHSPPAREGKPVSLVPGMRLGKIAGIELRFDFSVVLIASLVAFGLGSGYLPATHPGWSPVLVWSVAALAAVLLFVSILLHELSHALVGRRLGLRIDRITLFIFGGMAELKSEAQRPSVELWTAAAGPLTSLVLGALCTAAGLWLGQAELGAAVSAENMSELGPLASLLLYLGPVNVVLGLFNLVPGFPLDGGRVLRAALWWKMGDLGRATKWASRAGQAVALGLVLIGVSMMLGISVPFFGVGFGPGLWLILIGWFLNGAAARSYEQLLTHQALADVPVSDLMLMRFETVPPNVSIASVAPRFLHEDQRCFPVVGDGVFAGIVCMEDLRRVPETEWDRTPASAIMTPRSQLEAVAPETPASDALRSLAEFDVDQLPVVSDGVLLGLVRRRDLVRWATLKQGASSRVPA